MDAKEKSSQKAMMMEDGSAKPWNMKSPSSLYGKNVQTPGSLFKV
jgi:hypothetical protein